MHHLRPTRDPLPVADPTPAAHRRVHRPPQSAGIDLARDGAITTAAARVVRRWDRLANVTFAVALGVLGAAALWHWLSTCSTADAASLCASAAATPLFRWRDWVRALRTGARHVRDRAKLRAQLAYIEHRMQVIEFDLECFDEDLQRLPAQIALHRALLAELQVEMMVAQASMRAKA